MIGVRRDRRPLLAPWSAIRGAHNQRLARARPFRVTATRRVCATPRSSLEPDEAAFLQFRENFEASLARQTEPGGDLGDGTAPAPCNFTQDGVPVLQVPDLAAFQAAFDPSEDSPDPIADAGHHRHHPAPQSGIAEGQALWSRRRSGDAASLRAAAPGSAHANGSGDARPAPAPAGVRPLSPTAFSP